MISETPKKHAPPEKVVQDEIKKEDKKFLTGGIFFVVILGLVLLLGAFLLFRFLLLPVFKSLLGTFNSSPQPTPNSTTTTEQNTVLKDIDAVPYTWQSTDVKEIGLSMSIPSTATVSTSPNQAEVKVEDTVLSFTQKSAQLEELEQEVANTREALIKDNQKVGPASETEVAAIAGYSFAVTEPQKKTYVIFPTQEGKYIEIVVPDTENQERRKLIDDLLASIEIITEGESPLEELEG